MTMLNLSLLIISLFTSNLFAIRLADEVPSQVDSIASEEMNRLLPIELKIDVKN